MLDLARADPRPPSSSSGSGYAVRPLHGDEEGAVARLWEQLSPESRYARFCAGYSTPPSSLLGLLADVGGDRRAWLAFDDGDVVGLAHCVPIAGSVSRDVALVVADAHHRRGVGSRLVAAVLEHTKAAGVTELEADVLPGNRAARALLLQRWPSVVPVARGGLLHYLLPVTPPSGQAGRLG